MVFIVLCSTFTFWKKNYCSQFASIQRLWCAQRNAESKVHDRPNNFILSNSHNSILVPLPRLCFQQIYKESSEFVIPRDRATSCLMQIELSTGSQFASGEELRVENSVVYNGQIIHQQTSTRTARSVVRIFIELFFEECSCIWKFVFIQISHLKILVNKWLTLLIENSTNNPYLLDL